MPQALLKLRVGLRGPGVEIRGAPLKVRSETQYLQAYLSLSAPYTPPYLLASSVLTLRVSAPPVSLTTTECFSFSELKVRIIQAILAALAKFPSYLIRGIDILDCAMRNYYVFTYFLLTFLTFLFFYVFSWLLLFINFSLTFISWFLDGFWRCIITSELFNFPIL